MIIAALPEDRVRMAFERLMSHSRWPVEFVDSVPDAAALACKYTPAITVVQSSIDWRRLVGGESPVVVVVSSLDGRLWADVLSLGGYDLLIEPFEAKEVFRVLTMAWRHASHYVPVTTASSLRGLVLRTGRTSFSARAS